MHEEEDVEDKGIGEESGWKLVHGDVFRKPEYLSLFCAVIGTGTSAIGESGRHHKPAYVRCVAVM